MYIRIHIFDLLIPKMTLKCLLYSSYVCSKYQKIGSCKFKNFILLYLMSVTSASVIYQEVMLHCAIFWFKWFQGMEASENSLCIYNTDENVSKCCFYILSLPEWKKSGGSGMSYIITMEMCFIWNFKVLFWIINNLLTKMCFC